ncbi:MATE family efflux transporter [Campylobacter sp. 19-13652]|uniref:MATE family efflux transporter n=1 Tax=Campylobacter sp. 19-13652 TaxID=2840180 RepID=UPI001C74D0F8|nr:MATE family efflux transporter [Campylobacter sp. 19-13652]BCX79355.1 MATE family efflux transporter [Campylobacter sp. 19-13652]
MQNLKEKNISLTRLSVPIFFDMLLHFLTLLINTYMVTLVSVHLVGAMGAGNQVMDLFMTIFSFLSVGCSIVVAQALGAKNERLARRVIHASLTFNAILGVFCALVIFFFGHELLALMHVPSELRADSYAYLHILGWALCFDGIGVVMAAILRVYGYASPVMLVSFIMNLITITGNAIALFGYFGLPNFGLVGVGFSTLAGRVVALVVLGFMLVKMAKIRINLSYLFSFHFDMLRRVLAVGLPSAGENLLWMGQYMVAFGFVASMGADSLAVQTIYFQLTLLLLLFGAAISVANEVIVGHLVGAREFQKAYNQAFRALWIGMGATAAVVVAFYLGRGEVLSRLDITPAMREIMLPLFGLSIVLEIGRTFNIVMVNALRASGDARFPLATGLIFMWGVSLPLGYWLGIKLGFGIVGVWLGFVADEWLRGLVNTWRWKSRKWQEKALV